MDDVDGLLELLEKVGKKFGIQSAVIKDDSTKVLFVGDVHGDFHTIEIVKEIAKKYQRVVFLGDFVDRGKDDTDVVKELAEMYLNSNKFFVLGGNHDACYPNVFPHDWDARLEQRFGGDWRSVRDSYTRAFKNAPVAYLNKQYRLIALHGFIPSQQSDWDIEKWGRAGTKSAYEVMWNDPTCVSGINSNERGTGIYGIGPDITAQFMEKNKLDYLVRSHQPRVNSIIPIGGNKSTTNLVNIGSASYYGARYFFSLPEGELINATNW